MKISLDESSEPEWKDRSLGRNGNNGGDILIFCSIIGLCDIMRGRHRVDPKSMFRIHG